MNPSELEAVLGELREGLVGCPVQKARVPDPRRCLLELRRPGESILVCASVEPGAARVSVLDGRAPVAEGAPPPFQRRLREELIGCRLISASALAGPVAALRFERRLPSGEAHRRELLVELVSGGHLVLLTVGPDAPPGEGTVLALTPPRSPTRGLAIRRPWVAPPVRAGDPPTAPPTAPRQGEPFARAREAERRHGGAARRRSVEDLRRLLVAPVRARLSRLLRTLEKVRAEAGRQPLAEEHRLHGELLARHAAVVPRGAASVRLTTYGPEGATEVDVPLDPRRPPREQAERHFHQYRRLLRGSEQARQRLERLEEERSALEQELRTLEGLPPEALPPLARADEPAALARARGPPAARATREYRAADGTPIRVGKHARGNDELTFKTARPHDLWLHARGVPGSHVVVQLDRGGAVSEVALLDAAHLAAHHSEAKHEERVEVSYTSVKFVRRQKGGGPGQVQYTRERTILVRVERARLERILATER